MADNTAVKDLVIERIVDAPPALVWQAWSDPEHLMRWWGPEHFTSPTCKIDFRVGGTYLFCMQSPEGQQFWSTGNYVEIVPQERLVYTDSFADADGNVVSPTYYGMDESFPQPTTVIVTFEPLGGKTKMTLQHIGLPGGEMFEMTAEGWGTSLDKLAASVTS